ncbi:MAG: hypothetical protein CMM90_06355, partial [Rickettsiales bacterium]|nr:hypothetical protein [Rickettsiales bacterium]
MERGVRKGKGLNLAPGIGGSNTAPFLLTPLGLILASCGGGGSTSGNPVSQDPPSSTPSSVSYSGNVVKGPLNNALVFLDLNSDGIQDSNEPSVRTGSDGSYTLTTSSSNFTIVAISDDTTIDTSSGTVLSGVTLKAPSGATVVTPTTTLMKEGDLTAAQVATVLGLPSGVDPTSFNPYASGVDATKALAVEKVSQQLMSVVNSFAASAEGAGASQANAFTASLKSVVEVVKSKATASGTLDLTNSTDLDLIKTQASTEMASVSGISKTAFDALAADTTTAIKNVNAKIGSVTDLTSDAAKNTFSTVSALQDQVKTAATAEKASAGSGSASITFKTSSNVDTAASNKAPTDIALSSTSISEAASSLVIGTLSTTDSDQTAGTAFTYSLAELDDYSSFSINQATGELSFKSQPDYETKSSYKVTIISKDEGGKSFSETFSLTVINVRDSIDEALIKATVNYVNKDIYTDLK